MLSVEKLSIQSDEVNLLSPISFELNLGKIVGVIGASGSGKSLLASAILGDIPKGFTRGGNVTFCSDNSGDSDGLAASVALAAQSATVLDPLRTVMTQLLRRAKLTTQRKAKSTKTMIQNQNTQLINKQIGRCYPHQLSGGMAKKALLAQASWQQTDYILADEPCCGLDYQSAQALYAHLGYLAKQEGRGVLVISHNLKQLLSVADEILVLQEGQLVDRTTPDKIISGMSHPYTLALWQAIPANWHKERVEYAEVA
ncbi:ATP-binding cassette domain-containing protein [Shewanella eurypsychrophilus]|uniref:ATP-binding cassette domain-containing protein n=1 Tax=Shewanella eurypsychrophilus TaxID=2593656 RepID=A0ABX6V5C4_9GAMM|nr:MULTISPECIES: ATP-binding cassette domain-containing protein [Shewanella]QFU22249.1 ATP-binding cassette domain-containing protein [Shewanella sp. YLB-09]QPG57535.1 ATP-binding cassette domain-containing protein [Shewanella eurypsychrophilus]